MFFVIGLRDDRCGLVILYDDQIQYKMQMCVQIGGNDGDVVRYNVDK